MNSAQLFLFQDLTKMLILLWEYSTIRELLHPPKKHKTTAVGLFLN